MFNHRTSLQLDEFTAFTPLLPSRSKSSLTCSTDIMFASKTLSPAAVECDSIPKETVDPSTVRLVHSEVSCDVKCLGMDSELTPSGSLLLPPPQVASVQSSLSSLSVDNLGSSQLTGYPSSSMLHLHPFSQGSASGADSGSSSSYWVKSTGTGTSSSTFSDRPGPPSLASFMDMGKDTRGKKGHNYEVQDRRGGQSVSDEIPLIAYNARKRGRRFWHTLIRPSVLSFLDNPKRQDTSSTSFASTKLVASGASSSSLEELPPRPAPYFYPRRVGPQKDEISRENMHESFFCNLAELPTDPPTEVTMHKGNHRTQPQNRVELEVHGGGIEEGASIDSSEIETWRKRQAGLAAKRLRPSLRQRFGSSLRQSIGLQQLRSAFSEMDLSQLARQQDESEMLGPGINDDPFASLSTSPQLLPTEVILLPAASSSSIAPAASLTPTASQTPTTFLPLLCSSEFVLDFTNPIRDMKRRSFINMDPDYDNPPSSSSVSRSDNSHQPPPSFPYGNIDGLSVLGCCIQGDNGQTPTSIPRPQSEHVSEDLGILCQTPVLTPDLDSIEDSSPLLSDSFCVAVDATSLKHERDFSRTDTIAFPSLCSSQEHSPMPDSYEESALEEGSSQDQIFYPCALELLPRSVSLNSVGSDNPRSRRKFSHRGVSGEYLRDVSVASVDMAESIADFTLLAVEWPQPPGQTSPEPGSTSGDKEDECFILVDPVAANSSHIQEHPPRSPTSDIPSLYECQGTTCTKPLTFDKRKTSTTPVKSAKLSSSVDFVEVTIGSSVLTHATLPNILVLTPITDTQPMGTSISFRAASRPVLISFFAFHAETRLEAQGVSREGTLILAYVKLCTDHNQANPDTTIISLMNNRKDSSLMSAAEDGSVTFSLRLPITLGELAVAIAKVSFGKEMVSDVK